MLLSYHLRSQWNKVEVLSQAMDLLDALRTRQALPNDEVCVCVRERERERERGFVFMQFKI